MEHHLPFSILLFITLFDVCHCVHQPIECSEVDVACTAHEDNTVEYVGGVKGIDECRKICSDEKFCELLTYFDVTSFPLREACFLLSDCEEQVFIIHTNLSMIISGLSRNLAPTV